VRPPGALSPTEETIYGVKIPLLATSRGPSTIALAYTVRAVVIFGGSKLDNWTLWWVDQSSPNLSTSNVRGIVVHNAVFRLSIYLSVSEMFS